MWSSKPKSIFDLFEKIPTLIQPNDILPFIKEPNSQVNYTKKGHTPLLLAVDGNCSIDVINLLIARGSIINYIYPVPQIWPTEVNNSRVEYYQSALTLALQHYNIGFLHNLLTAGANANLVHPNGRTTLMLVMMWNTTYPNSEHKSALIDLMIPYISDINKCDDRGNTVLHYVREPEHLRKLILAGADVNIPNNFGLTPENMFRNYNVKFDLETGQYKKADFEHPPLNDAYY